MQVELNKGQTIMVEVDLQMPAATLHEVVTNRSGMPPEVFALYYQSKQLEGEAALSSWEVAKDATIEVKTRGRGGAPKPLQPEDSGEWIPVSDDPLDGSVRRSTNEDGADPEADPGAEPKADPEQVNNRIQSELEPTDAKLMLVGVAGYRSHLGRQAH